METPFSYPFLASRYALYRAQENPSSTDSASFWLRKEAEVSALHHAQMGAGMLLDDVDPSAPTAEEEGNDGSKENTRGNILLSSPSPGDYFVDSRNLDEECVTRNDTRVGGVEVDAHDEVIADDGIVERWNFAVISDSEMMACTQGQGEGSKVAEDAADSM